MLVGQPPFDTEGARPTLKKVIIGEYELPSHLSEEAKNLIQVFTYLYVSYSHYPIGYLARVCGDSQSIGESRLPCKVKLKSDPSWLCIIVMYCNISSGTVNIEILVTSQ